MWPFSRAVRAIAAHRRPSAAASSFSERDNLLIARSILSAVPWPRQRCAASKTIGPRPRV
jgi:hypothetical protein